MDDGSPQRYTVIDHNIALDVKISQAASEAPTVSPEVAREDEERRVVAIWRNTAQYVAKWYVRTQARDECHKDADKANHKLYVFI